MKSYLIFQDGSIYEGEQLGVAGFAAGEVVFNTGMTGYQEILTDPSYAGQIVLMTYPMIGNYGVNEDDFESEKIQPSAFIVHEACEEPSNWRSRHSLNEFMLERKIIGIKGIDTRAVTKKIRNAGVMMSAVVSGDTPENGLKRLLQSADYAEVNYVEEVSTSEPYVWGKSGREKLKSSWEGYTRHIALVDYGVKYNILRRLSSLGCRITVLPANSSAEEILAHHPQGIVLSPGPGDPAKLQTLKQEVGKLLGKAPLLGICLGHQFVGMAAGGKTFKLKFGHRGSNHPVQEVETGKISITSQNHGYAISSDGMSKELSVSHINLNDGTVEGFISKSLRCMTIQYHPEASPGPWDSRGFFSEFLETVDQF